MAPQARAASPTNILRRKAVEKRVSLSKSAIYERIADEQFPKPINLGGRAVGWIEAEIDAWLADRIQQSRSSEARA